VTGFPAYGVEIGGVLSSDRAVWGPPGSGAALEGDPTIDVTSMLVIAPAETLTLLPGTVVRLAADQQIFSNGQIIARGTPSLPIVFTSLDPNAGPGTWIAITLNSNGYGSAFEYVHINKAYQGISTYLSYPAIRNCLFQSCLEGLSVGIWDVEDGPAIENNTFLDNMVDGITSASSIPNIRRNVFRGNTIAVKCTGKFVPDLGDLDKNNPGENRFEQSAQYHIFVERISGVIKAEGNIWDAATAQEMLTKGYPANILTIYDDWDDDGQLNGSLASVDYYPIAMPTAVREWWIQ
jgi:hypothetical protein